MANKKTHTLEELKVQIDMIEKEDYINPHSAYLIMLPELKNKYNKEELEYIELNLNPECWRTNMHELENAEYTKTSPYSLIPIYMERRIPDEELWQKIIKLQDSNLIGSDTQYGIYVKSIYTGDSCYVVPKLFRANLVSAGMTLQIINFEKNKIEEELNELKGNTVKPDDDKDVAKIKEQLTLWKEKNKEKYRDITHLNKKINSLMNKNKKLEDKYDSLKDSIIDNINKM